MSEVDERAKAALDAPMRTDENGVVANEAGAGTVREFLVALLAELWRDPPKRMWGESGWDSPLEEALIKAGLVEGVLDEDGYVASSDGGAYGSLVTDAIHALAELPRLPELPPLDHQVEVLTSLLAHLRMRLEWIERGADYEQHPPNTMGSAGQAWARLLQVSAEERLEWLENWSRQANAGRRCFMANHDSILTSQRERIRKLEARITELGGDLP